MQNQACWRSTEWRREVTPAGPSGGWTQTATREQMIQSHLGLVSSVARRYRGHGVADADLVQEGIIGLIQAVDHFDWERGTPFGAYATLWIKQAVLDALPALRSPIRIPLRTLRCAQRLQQAIDGLTQTLQRAPTEAEVEARLGAAAQDLQRARELPLGVVSLEAQRVGDDESAAVDLADPLAAEPSAAAVSALTVEAVLRAFVVLDERERQILRLRFGMDSGEAHSLESVARQLGLTRHRVQQLENVALRKLQSRVPDAA